MKMGYQMNGSKKEQKKEKSHIEIVEGYGEKHFKNGKWVLLVINSGARSIIRLDDRTCGGKRIYDVTHRDGSIQLTLRIKPETREEKKEFEEWLTEEKSKNKKDD